MSLTFVITWERFGVIVFDFAKSNLSSNYSKKSTDLVSSRKEPNLIKKTLNFPLIFEQKRIQSKST